MSGRQGCRRVRLAAFLFLIATGNTLGSLRDNGAVVESVKAGFPAASAGLYENDLILEIRAAEQNDERKRLIIRDPFDVLVQELQLGRVGPVQIRYLRGHEIHVANIKADDQWGFRLRPVLSASQQQQYRRLVSNLNDKDVATYCAGVERVAQQLDLQRSVRGAAWMRWRCANAAGEANDWKRANSVLKGALNALDDTPIAAAALWLLQGNQAFDVRNFEQVRTAADNAISLAKTFATDSPILMESELLRPWVDVFEGRSALVIQAAESLLKRCAAQCQNTLVESDIRNLYGVALHDLEHLDDAGKAYRETIAIRSRLAPQSLGTASVHSNYALFLRSRGDSSGALDELAIAIGIDKAIAPGSVNLARSLSNLGVIHWDRGDLIEAESSYKEARTIYRRTDPDGYDEASVIQNLAYIARDRDNVDEAESLVARSKQIYERVAPKDQSLGLSYNLEGLIKEGRGDLDGADVEYRRAIAFWEHAAPGTSRHAWSVHNLGGTAEKRGNMETARKYFEMAFEMRHKTTPGTLDEARDLLALGRADLALGELASARSHLDSAAKTMKLVAPQRVSYALTLNALGRTIRQQGKPREAIKPLCEAERVLDAQRKRVSVSRENQAEYAARYEEIPRDCAEAHLDAGDAAAAFNVIERSRARALREQLQFRDEDIAAKSMPADLRKQRGELHLRRARLEGELTSLFNENAAEKREVVQAKLTELGQQEEQWFAQLATKAPRYAHQLRDNVFELQQILPQLSPNTVILIFVLGENRSYVLSLSGRDGRLRATNLLSNRSALARATQELRDRIVTREPVVTLDVELRAMYARLLRPVEKEISGATRLLIVPDVGLQSLPFAALQDDRGRYVAERWAIALAPSVSVALESVRQKRNISPKLLAVASRQPHPQANTASRVEDLPDLPSSELEVKAAAALYGANSQVLTGEAATEASARNASHDATVLHIAAHGYLDPRHPADSGLVLSGDSNDAENDGIVHAWEVMAAWQLDTTRLVVLSACETGIGKEVANEGIVGLTRAFQYAGAQSVVATLWPITDRPTARLMEQLHNNIVGGNSVAMALRDAQIDSLSDQLQDVSTPLIRGAGGLSAPHASSPLAKRTHPYYWAGFELFGVMP